ncbi:nucleotidyltransferase family protein [Enterobacter hormaechei]|jgi:predicted nucleotidyltransferase|uniref:nucleotidyltransferase family protein n=1 Tax=Enterobacter hormaechei TaxID=158836 RepID=UPI003F68BBD0
MKRSAVREAVGRFRAANPRVFGSVLHGTDRDGSDLDLLVDALPVPRCWTWAIWKKN